MNYSVKPQDVEFIAKITSHLHKKGDGVMVSDAHPGEWERVCINRSCVANDNDRVEGFDVRRVAGLLDYRVNHEK